MWELYAPTMDICMFMNLFATKRKKQMLENIEKKPRHIAFIMDGNGRWAQLRHMPREYGHSVGAKTFKRVVDHCIELGIEAVTVYAFSTENWSRPESEINSIMKLLSDYIDDAVKNFRDRDVEIRFIGDMSALDSTLESKITDLEETTRGRSFKLNIAINYSGRSELVHAVNRCISNGAEAVTEDMISENLYTKDSPPLDLIVRTGNEYRISNFLLWQAAYAELYFSEVLWPDFSDKDVDDAVLAFSRRKRRFGGLKNV